MSEHEPLVPLTPSITSWLVTQYINIVAKVTLPHPTQLLTPH